MRRNSANAASLALANRMAASATATAPPHSARRSNHCCREPSQRVRDEGDGVSMPIVFHRTDPRDVQ